MTAIAGIGDDAHHGGHRPVRTMVGGVPTVTRELARGLAERGHDVALVAPSPGWRGQARHRRAGQRHLPRLIALALVRRHAAGLPPGLRGAAS